MIDQAVQILRRGGVIGLPTETVYGLAADATNPDAVAKIFALKGRPATNPLIVHVADVAAARRYADDWPDTADRLATAFWPGPLTLVVTKASAIPAIVTAGGPTAGLRVPAHAVARQVLEAFNGPLAAPSANRSNHVSPTTAAHVCEEFGDEVPLVLDGGPCTVGIESTVVDVSGGGWRILRPGAVTESQIAHVLGLAGNESSADAVSEDAHAMRGGSAVARSPGQLPVHYAPRTPAFRFEAQERQGVDLTNAVVLEPTFDAESYARNLYARLRMLDTQGLDAIYVEMPPDVPAWHAVRDRLLRATRPLSSRA